MRKRTPTSEAPWPIWDVWIKRSRSSTKRYGSIRGWPTCARTWKPPGIYSANQAGSRRGRACQALEILHFRLRTPCLAMHYLSGLVRRQARRAKDRSPRRKPLGTHRPVTGAARAPSPGVVPRRIPDIPEEAWHSARCARPVGLKPPFAPFRGSVSLHSLFHTAHAVG